MIETLKLRPNQRLIAISDIHAHAALLHALLAQVHYCEDDALVIVGDLLERGNEGLAVIRAVMELKKRNPDVRPLLGNWDYSMRRIIDEENVALIWRYIGTKRRQNCNTIFGEMADECGIALESEADVARFLPVIREKYSAILEFLRALPVVLDTGDMIFVHGGIPDEDLDGLDRENIYRYLKNDEFYREDTCFSKTVIVGHIPTMNFRPERQSANPFFDTQRNIIGIDGGCGIKRDGQLNALIFRAGEFTFESVCDLPVIRALSDQQGSEGTVNSRYFDKVEIMNLEGPVAKIRHLPTGSALWTTTDSILRDETGFHSEATDEVLNVSAGEEFFLVERTPRGILAKKDGVTGWYYGAWEPVQA